MPTRDLERAVETRHWECERAELERVLTSHAFRRAPGLVKTLSYLTERLFAGDPNITEYRIAVEGLGRKPNFDPLQDSIVRVNVHALRKRLHDYYFSEGREHEVQIVLSGGSYVPSFVHRSDGLLEEAAQWESQFGPPNNSGGMNDLHFTTEHESAEAAGPVKVRSRWKFIGGGEWLWVLVLAVLVAITWSAARWYYGSQIDNMRRLTGIGAPAAYSGGFKLDAARDFAIRILAGDRAGKYTDHSDQVWLPDHYFTGGTSFSHPDHAILRTLDPSIYTAGREGDFRYDIPVSPGLYEVHLFFAETEGAKANDRWTCFAFNQGARQCVDVDEDAGGLDTATEKIYRDIRPASDGEIHIHFIRQRYNAFPFRDSILNALEIVPGLPGKMRPIRFTTNSASLIDRQGRLWLADHYFGEGQTTPRFPPSDSEIDPDLFRSERYGHFTYAIPVARGGLYSVKVYLREGWFGPQNAGGTAGSRVFDLYCNGVTLLKDFDILRESHLQNHEIIKQFNDIEPSPMDKLDLEFVPIANYAVVNAIEVSED
jgi:Malectin domain